MNISSNKNLIGLDRKMSKKTIKELDKLLANYQIFYMNLRGFHWNIKGQKFFELHLKFEELYNEALIKVDEIAERILTLGGTPSHTFTRYLVLAQTKELEHISDGTEAVKSILKSLSQLLKIERKIMAITDQSGDEGTNALMSDYIREQEKLSWMFSAFLG